MEILQGEIAVSNSIYAKYDSAGYKQHGRFWACLSDTTDNGEGLTYQARSRGERGAGGGVLYSLANSFLNHKTDNR